MKTLTVDTRWPRWGGGGGRRFSGDCSVDVCDRELKFDMTPIQAGRYKLFFYFQVRSGHWPMTTQLISKHPHSHEMLQLRNAANGRQSFSGRLHFQTATSPRVGTHILYLLDFSCTSSAGQGSHVTSSIMGEIVTEVWNCTEIAHFAT